MSRLNSLEIFNPNMVNTVIADYQKLLREQLLAGEEVYLNGIGKLRCKFRKVKNDCGRNYTIRIKVVQDRDFSNELISEYNKDNTKYSRGKK